MNASKQEVRRQRRSRSAACAERRAWRLYLRTLYDEDLYGDDFPQSAPVSTTSLM
ncbi:MAG: hypothetical protein R3B53_03375 [Candidatus Paceibacterota bacterium]